MSPKLREVRIGDPNNTELVISMLRPGELGFMILCDDTYYGLEWQHFPLGKFLAMLDQTPEKCEWAIREWKASPEAAAMASER
jgi:hypothetical protein